MRVWSLAARLEGPFGRGLPDRVRLNGIHGGCVPPADPVGPEKRLFVGSGSISVRRVWDCERAGRDGSDRSSNDGRPPAWRLGRIQPRPDSALGFGDGSRIKNSSAAMAVQGVCPAGEAPRQAPCVLDPRSITPLTDCWNPVGSDDPSKRVRKRVRLPGSSARGCGGHQTEKNERKGRSPIHA
jgi:hypothetical protein